MGEFVIKDDVPEVKPRKKHNGWKIFLAWFGGFIGGIGMLVGGVFIGLTVIKSSQVVSMLGLDPNEFLGPNFQNESLLTLIKHVTNTKFNSLEDVYYVTPYDRALQLAPALRGAGHLPARPHAVPGRGRGAEVRRAAGRPAVRRASEGADGRRGDRDGTRRDPLVLHPCAPGRHHAALREPGGEVAGRQILLPAERARTRLSHD